MTRAFTPALLRRLRGLPRSARELNRSLVLLSFLRERGWHRSMSGLPTGGAEAVPYLPMSLTAWLEPRLLTTDRVFEYGCGGSTLWFASRVREVRSIETDAKWATRVQAPANVTVRLIDRSDPGYPSSIRNAAPPFDVVLIDGLARNECVDAAVGALAAHGLVLLDDSDWPCHAPAVARFTEHGFHRIDFVGLLPGSAVMGCTSVFMQPDASRWLATNVRLPWLGGGPPGG
jgi:hypothetical protein